MRCKMVWLIVAVAVPAIGPCNDSLIPNPDFDAGIEQWTPTSDAQISWEPNADVDGAPDSGAMRIRNVSGDPDSANVVSDCFDTGAGTYDFGGWFYLDGAQPDDPRTFVTLQLFDGPGCTGNGLPSPLTDGLTVTDTWFLKSSTGNEISSDVRSSRVQAIVRNRSTEPMEALVDSLFIVVTLFEDGFEP
jgi:hypothetical protein